MCLLPASICSGVDVNSEEKLRNDLFDDFPKISHFFLGKILNDLLLARYK